MKRLLVFAPFIILLCTSCELFHGRTIRGNGHVTTESRNYSNFNSIDASSAVEVYLTQDPNYSVKVQIDEDLQPYIIIRQENGTLHIHQEDNTSLDATGGIKVFVSAPAFRELEASGACKLVTESPMALSEAVHIHLSGASHGTLDIKSPAVSVEMSGASSVRLKGETKDLSIDGSGASHAKCYDLLSENANVGVSGASSAEVFASVKLDAEASGASHIRYRGNATVSKSESGASGVSKVD